MQRAGEVTCTHGHVDRWDNPPEVSSYTFAEDLDTVSWGFLLNTFDLSSLSFPLTKDSHSLGQCGQKHLAGQATLA